MQGQDKAGLFINFQSDKGKMKMDLERKIRETYELVKDVNQKVDYLIESRKERYLYGGLENAGD